MKSLHFEGIKKGFPKIRHYFGRIADLISLVRPFTLVAPLVVSVFGSAICLGTGFWSQLPKVLFVSLTLMLCQSVGQVLNQAVGVNEDKINKPYRPIPQGRVTVEDAYGLAFLLSLFAVGRAFTINVTFGMWITIILFFAVFYNIKPFQARKYLWINLLWMSVSRGLLPFAVIWSAYEKPFVLKPWLLGSIAFLWVLSWQSSKDVNDLEGDKKYGINTLPVVYNLEKTKKIIRILSLLPFIPLVLYVKFGFLTFPYLLLLNLAFLRELNLWGFNKPSKLFENTWAWAGFYLGLSAIYVLSFVAELL